MTGTAGCQGVDGGASYAQITLEGCQPASSALYDDSGALVIVGLADASCAGGWRSGAIECFGFGLLCVASDAGAH